MINTGIIEDREITQIINAASEVGMCLKYSPDSFTAFLEYTEVYDVYTLVVMSETGDTEPMKLFARCLLSVIYDDLVDKIRRNLGRAPTPVINSESRKCKTRL